MNRRTAPTLHANQDTATLPVCLPSPRVCVILRFVNNVTVTQLTDQLLASYARVGGINHLDGKNLPSKTAIAAITADLLRLLFPGFFDERPIHSSELKVEITTLMDSVRERLEDEIYKSLQYGPPPDVKKKELRPVARRFPGQFLTSLPRVRGLLQMDV